MSKYGDSKTISESGITSVVKSTFDETLGVATLGFLTGVFKVRNQNNAEELIRRLEASEINLDNHLVQSDEFLGYTAKVLIALSTATTRQKIDYLLNAYINGVADVDFRNKSERFNELIDVLSSLSMHSIQVVVEIYKYHLNNGLLDTNDDINRGVIKHLNDAFSMTDDDIYSICHLLTAKGLVFQHQLFGYGFVPQASPWVKDIIHLLEVENQFQ